LNYYINETFKKWKAMYLQVLENKRGFNEAASLDFYTTFVQECNDFARELFLDPALCENPCLVLPQLTRENYN
jgi:hypothetical protein